MTLLPSLELGVWSWDPSVLRKGWGLAKIPSNSLFYFFVNFSLLLHFPSSLPSMQNMLNSLWHFWQQGHFFPILFKNPDHVRTDSVFPFTIPSDLFVLQPLPLQALPKKVVIFHAVSAECQSPKRCPCFSECRKFSVFPLGLSESMEWIPEFLILPAATEPLPTLCLRKKWGKKSERRSKARSPSGLRLGSVLADKLRPACYSRLPWEASQGRKIRVIKIRQRIFKLEAKRGCFSNSK